MSKRSDNGEIRKLRRQQAALANFGRFAFRAEVLEPVLTEAARLCAEGLDVPCCKLLRHRREHHDLVVEAGVGWHEGVVGSSVAPDDRSSPAGRAYQTGEPVITTDLRQDHDFELPAIYKDHGIVSSVNVVIQGEGEAYGVLEADAQTRRHFDAQDVVFLEGFANVVADAVSAFARLAALQAALTQRDVLARELQHRVRNNLQVVYHLLTRQAQRARADARRGFLEVARQVMTLAQVYEHLLGDDIASANIEIGAYLQSLCASLADFHRGDRPNVTLDCHVEALSLELDAAAPVGIAVNELISNAFEHAFDVDDNGRIEVDLRHDRRTGEAILTVRDDGRGAHTEPTGGRLGLGLVQRLVQQLRGRMELRSERGLTCTIRLPLRASSGDG